MSSDIHHITEKNNCSLVYKAALIWNCVCMLSRLIPHKLVAPSSCYMNNVLKLNQILLGLYFFTSNFDVSHKVLQIVISLQFQICGLVLNKSTGYIYNFIQFKKAAYACHFFLALHLCMAV